MSRLTSRSIDDEAEMDLVESVTPLFGFDLSLEAYQLARTREAIQELQISNPEHKRLMHMENGRVPK